MNEMWKKLTNKIAISFVIIITILVFYFTLRTDFQQIVTHILNMNLFWFFVAFLFLGIHWLFRSLALYYSARNINPEYSLKRSILIGLATNFFNSITPFSSGGQPYQMYALKKDGFRISQATMITMQSFISFQIALIFLGILAVTSNALFHIFENVGILKELVLIGFLFNIFILLMLFLLSFSQKVNRMIFNFFITLLSKIKVVKNKSMVLENMNQSLSDFHVGIRSLLGDKQLFIRMILIHFISIVSLYVTPLFVLYSLGIYDGLNPIITVLVSTYVMMIAAFLPTPGGSGGVEYGFLQFFGTFISGSMLSAMMILWRLLTYHLGIIIGVVAFELQKRK